MRLREFKACVSSSYENYPLFCRSVSVAADPSPNPVTKEVIERIACLSVRTMLVAQVHAETLVRWNGLHSGAGRRTNQDMFPCFLFVPCAPFLATADSGHELRPPKMEPVDRLGTFAAARQMARDTRRGGTANGTVHERAKREGRHGQTARTDWQVARAGQHAEVTDAVT